MTTTHNGLKALFKSQTKRTDNNKDGKNQKDTIMPFRIVLLLKDRSKRIIYIMYK